jgi:hypothetical protein
LHTIAITEHTLAFVALRIDAAQYFIFFGGGELLGTQLNEDDAEIG